MRMKKINSKKPSMGIGMDKDWNLPHLTFNNEDLPVGKTHDIGKTHVMQIRARKVSENENGSTYKVTHVQADKGKKNARRYLLVKKPKN